MYGIARDVLKDPNYWADEPNRGGRMSEVKKLSIIDDYADINRRLSQLQPKKGVAPAKKTACSMCLDIGWVWDTKGRRYKICPGCLNPNNRYCPAR